MVRKQGVRTYRSHGLDISKQNPELENSQASNPGNCEKSNPFDTGRCAQTETGHRKPKPPSWFERLGRTLFMLIGERGECQCRECSHNHKGGVEEDQACLGEEAIF